MKKDYGLFIIWSNARSKENEIVDDIKSRFDILNIFDITWDKSLFSNNLTRFYGENLPRNSSKEKHCGNESFLLIIVKDEHPIYNYRMTSKGKKFLNVNFFDSKTMYRKWTGKHMVHGTNDFIEFKHDLVLLLGCNVQDYLKKYTKNNTIIKKKDDLIGARGWKSLEQIFYVLNETTEYLVLRNFQKLPTEYQMGIHSDIDILCQNQYNMICLLNAEAAKKSKRRAKFIVRINDSFVNMDLRYIGDKYYEIEWEKRLLNNRVFTQGLYIPCKDDFNYSLLYHALVQKGSLADDYKNTFKKVFGTDNIDTLRSILNKYMTENNYKYTDAIDYSVFFNKKTTKKNMRFFKMIYFIFNRIYYKIAREIVHREKQN